MKRYIFLNFLFLIIYGSFLNEAYALDRFDIVSTEEMKQLYDKRQRGEVEFILVNTLDEIIYRHSAIPGSVNIPSYKVEELQERLGEAKNKLIIFY